ncbi:MAG: hypothetical protein HFI06_11835 [Eubacterium sp.]|jgi:uncharacterized membrane protein YvbJ|nr:hypothetical protein [Eubacterium sp.]
MYCRTCGNKINDNAEICVKCGCRPFVGKSFCQNCGAKTTSQQVVCTKCGTRLKSSTTMEQKKKYAKNTGFKIIGNILIGMGCFMFIFAILNIAIFVINFGTFDAIGRGAASFRCLVFGLLFFIPGRILKKK